MSITLDVALHTAIDPALKLLPRAMDSDAARVELLAIGQQETDFNFRRQVTNTAYIFGPATGFWQTERGTVSLLMSKEITRDHMMALCTAQKVPFDSPLVHARLAFDDVLAAGVARLILWADPLPLPLVHATPEEGWKCYLRNWRPGLPRWERWESRYLAAQAQVIT